MRDRCYFTDRDKAAKFPATVIPALLAQARAESDDPTLDAWLRAGGVLAEPWGITQLLTLHELARAGRYRSSNPLHCDPYQHVADTITAGGDCDQWAAVVMAALHALGYEFGLYTFGAAQDEFQHVAPAAQIGLRWYLLDAKGDATGMDFDQADPTYPTRKLWRA